MSVLQILMAVITLVQTLMGALAAPVIQDIAQQVIVADVQKLMNVQKEQMAVLTLVQTLMGALAAPVIQGIGWQVMDEHAMVSPILNLLCVSSREL